MRTPSRNPIKPQQLLPPGPYVHPCEHPGCPVAHGPFGYQAAGRLRWFCDEHKGEGLAWMLEAKGLRQ